MQFGILGPLEVRTADGDVVPLGGPRPRALLVMLLLDPGQVVSVDQLIDGQYADDPPAGAANALQSQVSRLRRAMPADVVTFHGSGYRIAVDPEDVDAHRFERLAREGHRLLSAGQHTAAVGVLREALALWRGPALADLPHGRSRATRLEDLRLAATEDLVEAELATPEGSSVAELRRLVTEHPLRERFRAQLMRALHAAGRPAEALTEYDEIRRLLADELGADPSAELTDVHLAILRAETPGSPTAGATGRAGASRTAPPAQLTSFVGREAELDRLAELGRDARLVTVLGPGGTGKTRLAVEAAERLGREVCFADLSVVPTAGMIDGPAEGTIEDAAAQGLDDVPLAVLSALGLRDAVFQAQDGPTPAERLVTALGDTDLVLILDNCEHVVAGAAALAHTLLAACPRLAVVATSREPLGITGEALLPLSPLATAPPDAAAGDAASFPAVRLFADRAAAVRPGFAVDETTVGPVVEICTALDGLPLAVELAAARLRQFTVAEIAERLAEHGTFRLLSRGDRTVAARHQTLRAVVEWSWTLLGADEQRLARRFSVFTGGAPLEAVEAICGGTGDSTDSTEAGDPEADERLADLVDKSMVEFDGERYRMLDTIRLYCAEQLAAAGETEQWRARHAAYHLALAQRAEPHLRRAEQLTWLARLSADHGNLMTALRWAVGADRTTAMELVAAMAAYWWLRGLRSQAGEAAAALLGDGPPPGLEEEYVACVVHAVPTAAPEHWARGSEIMRTIDHELRYPFGVAMWAMAAGPPPEPTADAARLLGTDPWNVALGHMSLVLLGTGGGLVSDGEREMRAALTTFRELGDRWGTAQALDWLARGAGWRGEWERAGQLWAEAYDLQDQLGALEECADVLYHRAACLIRQGELDAAAADLDLAAELIARSGQSSPPAEIPLRRGQLARARGDLATAATHLGRALEIVRSGGFGGEWMATTVFTQLAHLAETTGDLDGARRWHAEAFTAGRASPLQSDLATAVEGQAAVAVLDGDGRRAAELLGAAVALRGVAVVGDADVARVAVGAQELIGASEFAAAYSRAVALAPADALPLVGA